MNKLSNLAQKAIAAFKVAEYITKVTYITNTELAPRKTNDIDQQQKEFQKAQTRLNKLNAQEIVLIRDKLLKDRLIKKSVVNDKNYEQIMSLFKLGHGVPVKQLPSSQPSVLKAADGISKKLVFCPSSTTVKLFQSFLKNDTRFVVFGVEGIGKRISSLLFAHLSAIITELKLKEDAQTVAPFINETEFSSIPKLIYHSIEPSFQLPDIVRQVWMQLSEFDFPLEEYQLYLASQNKRPSDEDSLKFISSLLENTKKKCDEKGISLSIVVNQSKIYDELAEELASYLARQKDDQAVSADKNKNRELMIQRMTGRIIGISNYLKIFSKYASRLVMITSKTQEKDTLSAVKQQWKHDPLFNINLTQPASRYMLHSSYRLTQQYEQAQTFLLLLFEIMRKFPKYSIKLTQKQEQQFAAFFKSEVNVQYDYHWSYRHHHVWSPRITHKVLNKKAQGQSISKILKGIQKWKKQKSKPVFSKYLIQLPSFTDVLLEIEDNFITEKTFYEDFYRTVSQKEENQRTPSNLIQDALFRKNMFGIINILSEKSCRGILFFLFLVFIQARSCIKDCKYKIYSNRFIFESTAKYYQQNFKDEISYLLKQEKLSLENGKLVMNSPPQIIMNACQFAPQKYLPQRFI